jgi:hypothetical protein
MISIGWWVEWIFPIRLLNHPKGLISPPSTYINILSTLWYPTFVGSFWVSQQVLRHPKNFSTSLWWTHHLASANLICGSPKHIIITKCVQLRSVTISAIIAQMPFSSTSIAYTTLICSMLLLLIGTSFNHVSRLIASIASPCCNLSPLSCLFVQGAILGRMARLLANETSTWLITLHLLGHLGRSFLFCSAASTLSAQLLCGYIAHSCPCNPQP